MIIQHEYIDKDELLFEMTNAFIPQDMDTCRAHALAKKLIANAPAADVAPVVHAYWTGKLTSDEAFAEGVPATATEEEREEYQKWKDHCTHCSNCKGGYDDRKIYGIRYCHFCGAKMDGGKR